MTTTAKSIRDADDTPGNGSRRLFQTPVGEMEPTQAFEQQDVGVSSESQEWIHAGRTSDMTSSEREKVKKRQLSELAEGLTTAIEKPVAITPELIKGIREREEALDKFQRSRTPKGENGTVQCSDESDGEVTRREKHRLQREEDKEKRRVKLWAEIEELTTKQCTEG